MLPLPGGAAGRAPAEILTVGATDTEFADCIMSIRVVLASHRVLGGQRDGTDEQYCAGDRKPNY